MTALNSMARLPADGESVQSRSSGSIKTTPDVPLALAVEAAAGASTLADAKGQHAAQLDTTGDASAKPEEEPQDTLLPRIHVATVDSHKDEEGCAGARECQLGENTTRPVPGPSTNATCATELMETATARGIAPTRPQEGLPTPTSEVGDDKVAFDEKVGNPSKENNVVDESKADHIGEHEPCDGEAPRQTKAVIDKHMGVCETADGFVEDKIESCAVAEVGEIGASPQPLVQVDLTSEALSANPEAGLSHAELNAVSDVEIDEEQQGGPTLTDHEEEKQGTTTAVTCPQNQDEESAQDVKETEDSDSANPSDEEVFFSSSCFTGAKDGYVFKTGDKGLGFYVDGYVDRQARRKRSLSHRPWNAGPGEQATKRGPLGPVPKPFKKIVPYRTRKEKRAAEENDTRPFMARMVAQRNSRGFQSNLFERERVLDKHILYLLEKFSDPTFFKKKHGYNVHGQMLGKDGKMIVKVTPEKTEEEKARLPWYRKVYEDRLGKHLPSKRLGDSIEARREAYAYSRHFTAELGGRQDELNRALTKALKARFGGETIMTLAPFACTHGQTKLEFITEDYHYPGAYDTDGKVILEKGAPVSNELHRTDAQNERACTYRYKAIRRYRAAHGDIVSAIAKKDKALQKVLKKTDPALLVEISEEAVTSTGMGIYRQTKRAGERDGSATGQSSAVLQPTERPEQLRQKFAHSLKAQIKGKDKALLKEIAALEEDEAEQMLGDFGKGTEVLPNSWRQDPEGLKRMERRRKELIAENAADRRKVVCPWRPGGKHIAQEPWKPFIPRDHRPPVRSASEGKAETHSGSLGATSATQDGRRGVSIHEKGDEKKGAERRPRTAPAHRRKRFMDAISPRARRILAAQAPGTPLHSVFSTYSNDPFPLETRQKPSAQSASPRTEYSANRPWPTPTPEPRTDTLFQTSGRIGLGTQQRAWAEISCSPTSSQTLHGGFVARPHSAAAEVSKKLQTPPRRPATACGTRVPRESTANAVAASNVSSTNQAREHEQDHRSDGQSRDLHVQNGPGVTVLWARLCSPSSDLVYKRSVWPEVSAASRPTRRRGKPRTTSATAPVSATTEVERQHEWDATPGNPSTGPGTINGDGSGGGKGQPPRGTTDTGGPLEDMENCLYASSSQRVNHRKRVFRGYSDRSRRERTWDPGSEFYAEGASKHSMVRPSPCNGRINGGWRGGKGESLSRGSLRQKVKGDATKRKHRRDSRHQSRLSGDDDPVDMDWEKVDIARFIDGSKEIEKVLDGELFAVVTDDESPVHLGECFQEAQELVESASVLLGCPENERERFRKQIRGDFTIGHYVATVSRLNLLWTTACGVVEIVSMIHRRRGLLEVFCSEVDEQPAVECASVYAEEAKGHTPAAPPIPVSALSRQHCVRQYETRLELAEYTIAIAESIKLWTSVIPWRVRVLFSGEPVLTSLSAEEEALPWPPDPDQPGRSFAPDGALTMPDSVQEVGMHHQHRPPCDGTEDKTSCPGVCGYAPEDENQSNLGVLQDAEKSVEDVAVQEQ
ncbi:unnamed protein product [Ectocarpus fasciculatus]